MKAIREYKGYLYIYPYAGDDFFIHKRKITLRHPHSKDEERRFIEELSLIHREAVFEGNGVSINSLLAEFEGRFVRVLVRSDGIEIKVLE